MCLSTFFFKISDQNISLFEESEQNNLSALAMNLIVSVLTYNQIKFFCYF